MWEATALSPTSRTSKPTGPRHYHNPARSTPKSITSPGTQASEPDPDRVLRIVRDHARDDQRIFVGVIDPLDPRVETVEEVCDRVLAAARYIPVERLGTCDDCGFAPFADDTSTSRETAPAKIEARVLGTQLAADKLGA